MTWPFTLEVLILKRKSNDPKSPGHSNTIVQLYFYCWLKLRTSTWDPEFKLAMLNRKRRDFLSLLRYLLYLNLYIFTIYTSVLYRRLNNDMYAPIFLVFWTVLLHMFKFDDNVYIEWHWHVKEESIGFIIKHLKLQISIIPY